MTKQKSTKRALLLSALSLLMCVSMLIGSTFAWFADSVTSAGNIIKSGTLDVTMEWADGTKAVPADDSSDWIDASKGAIFNNDKWEPGYTEVRHIKIANEGTLALKYQLNILANGEVSKLADVIDVYYLDPAEQLSDRAAISADKKLGTLSQVLANISTTASGNLEAGKDHTITLALKMNESAGNEYQGLSLGSDFSIQLLATQLTSEFDSFDNQYDKDAMVEADTQEEAQAALDNAVDGTVIVLKNGVDYGTLYLRQSALSKSVDITDWAGDGDVERYRKIENLTILGNGAKVDAIKTETSTYSKGAGNDHSGEMQWLDSYIEIVNLKVSGVTFTGNALNALGFNEKASIDGLTIADCTLVDEDGDSRLFYTDIANKKTYTDKTTGEVVMTQVMKNISIVGCEVTGAYQVAEFRGTENITITGNTSTGIKARDYLLSGGGAYTGTINISNNISHAGEERFVRAAIGGDATVNITNNTISEYKGADADYIKVTDATGTVTIENNTISYGSAASAQAALDAATDGTTINLVAGVDYGTLYLRQSELSKSVDITDWAGDGDVERYRKIENLTILGNGAKVDAIKTETSTYSKGAGNDHSGDMQWLDSYIEIENLVVDGVNFTGEALNAVGFSEKASINGLTIKNCTLNDADGDSRLFYTDIATTAKSEIKDKTTGEVVMTRVMKNISIIDCEVTGAYQVAEFRGTENITITGNTSEGIKARDYLLSGDVYSGTITISNNKSSEGTERFVRAAVNGNATVIITNNTITDYKGADEDYIKVTDATGTVTIERNTITYAD